MSRTTRKALASLILATTLSIPTIMAAPAAQAHTIRTYLDTHTNVGSFHAGEASYYAIRTKASAPSGKGIRGKAALYLDGKLQRVRYLHQGSILFRIYRSELRDGHQTTVSIRVFPRSPHRQEKIIRKEITDTNVTGRILQVARQQLGKPYRWGAGGPNSYDCSGLVQYVYRHATGKYIPHYTGAIRNIGRVVNRPQLGDIVWTSGHVSIYAGHGRVIEAAQPGTRVRRVSMWQRDPVYIRP